MLEGDRWLARHAQLTGRVRDSRNLSELRQEAFARSPGARALANKQHLCIVYTTGGQRAHAVARGFRQRSSRHDAGLQLADSYCGQQLDVTEQCMMQPLKLKHWSARYFTQAHAAAASIRLMLKFVCEDSKSSANARTNSTAS